MCKLITPATRACSGWPYTLEEAWPLSFPQFGSPARCGSGDLWLHAHGKRKGSGSAQPQHEQPSNIKETNKPLPTWEGSVSKPSP